MVRETSLSPDHFIYPLFVTFGKGVKRNSLHAGLFSGICRSNPQAREGSAFARHPFLLLFGIPEQKDEAGSGAYDDRGVVRRRSGQLKINCPSYTLLPMSVCVSIPATAIAGL